MSWNVGLFINLAPSIELLAHQVGEILNIDLKRVEDEDGVRYESFEPDFIVDLYGDHGLVNDRDMNFEDFSLELRLQRLNRNPDQSRERALSAARTVFEQLKKTGQYQLMLVEDVQKRLDSFDPKSNYPTI
jgi:hypothetical protein